MSSPNTKDLRHDRIILLLLFALFLLAPPLLEWWAKDDAAWYLPYLIWLALIVPIFILQRRARRDPDDEL